MFRFLSRQLRGHRVAVVTAIVMSIAQVGADVIGALPIKWVLDKVVNHRDPGFPMVGRLAGLFDASTSRDGLLASEHHTQIATILAAGTTFAVLGVFSAVLAHVQMRMATRVAQRLSADLRAQVFARMQSLPLDWHAQQRTGDLIQRVTGNVADIEKLVTDGLVDLLAGFLTLLGIVIVMLSLSWSFTLVSVGIIPLLFVVVLRYTLAIKAATRRAAKAAARVTDVAAEDIRAITEIKAFTLEEHESARFAERVSELRRHASRAGRLQAEFTPLVQVLIALATAVIVGVGGAVAAGHDVSLGLFTIPAGTITIGTLAVFLSYLKQLYQPMRNLSKLANMAATASSGAERINEVLAAEPEELGERPDEPTRHIGHVRFDHVAFGYLPNRPVLRDVSLDIPPGQRVALVGLSGSGKTTLAKLIPRFHCAWVGTVSVDGRDVTTLPLHELRSSISFVPQDSVLFEGTIRENVAVGRPSATIDEIVDSCTKAHIHDDIEAMPDGYDSLVREGGKNLSSGQRQRLAIARAMLRDAPILILDEPTASLDVEAEAEVMRALDTLIEGRTVLMISHRLSTLGNVDQIVVLKEGRIAERGTAGQLRRSGGLFAKMLDEQNRYNGSKSRPRGDAVRPAGEAS